MEEEDQGGNGNPKLVYMWYNNIMCKFNFLFNIINNVYISNILCNIYINNI